MLWDRAVALTLGMKRLLLRIGNGNIRDLRVSPRMLHGRGVRGKRRFFLGKNSRDGRASYSLSILNFPGPISRSERKTEPSSIAWEATNHFSIRSPGVV